MITAPQLRAARALLGIDQPTLARRSNLSLPTIQRMETSGGLIRGNVDSLVKVIQALEDMGVELIGEGGLSSGGGRGVRLREREVRANMREQNWVPVGRSLAVVARGEMSTSAVCRPGCTRIRDIDDRMCHWACALSVTMKRSRDEPPERCGNTSFELGCDDLQDVFPADRETMSFDGHLTSDTEFQCAGGLTHVKLPCTEGSPFLSH